MIILKSLVINKQDLKHNINKIKEKAKKSETKIIAIVKGNGYGLGLIEYSKFLTKSPIGISITNNLIGNPNSLNDDVNELYYCHL